MLKAVAKVVCTTFAIALTSCSHPPVLPPEVAAELDAEATGNATAVPARDYNGWTLFTPAPDSRIVYVSTRHGDDSSGEVYRASSAALGEDPRRPTGDIKPFRTFAAAFAQTRDGYPDWVLLRRGDSFTGPLKVRNGRSRTEPFLLASYGNEGDLPLVKIGSEHGVKICCESFNDIAIQGLDFYAHTRDPGAPTFVSTEGGSGISVFVHAGHHGRNLLIEGNRIRFAAGNAIQAAGKITGALFRRNLVANSYSTKGHSQGLYVHNVPMIVEGNVFDHNGWHKKQEVSVGNKAGGQATMFNHNTYFTDTENVVFRNNIFLRPSSMGNKWTANTGKASTRDLMISDNLYIDGEIGISIGGNKPGPYRFKNIIIADNVLLGIGNSQPTDRDFAWYMQIQDWDTGSVTGNTFIHPGSETTSNIFGILVEGTNRLVRFTNNSFYGFGNGYAIAFGKDASLQNLAITHNRFIMQPDARRFVRLRGPLHGLQLAQNTYVSTGDTSFAIKGHSVEPGQWFDRTLEQGSELKQGGVDWSFIEEPYTPIVAYQLWLEQQQVTPQKETASPFKRFVSALHEQGYPNWDSAYSANAINEWIRGKLQAMAPASGSDG